jgi:hypothetical protein
MNIHQSKVANLKKREGFNKIPNPSLFGARHHKGMDLMKKMRMIILQ